MTEPQIPESSSTDESTALALLDARGRQAATRLRAAVDAVLAEAAAGAAPDGPDGLDGPDCPDCPDVADGPDVAVVGLRRTVPGRGPGRGRGRTWLLAAAVLAVVGLVTALVLLARADDQEGMVTDDVPSYLVPGWLPDGWEVQDARTLHVEDTPGALTGSITVYGAIGADDPWTGPRVTVWQGRGEDLGADEGSGIEQIEVGGRPATFEDQDGKLVVTSVDGEDLVMVMGDQLDRPAVLTAAEAAVGGDVAEGLPDGFEQVASGPLSAMGTMSGFAFDGLSVVYGGVGSDGQVGVVQQAGDADDAELVRLMADDVEVTEVRGLPAYLVGGTLLQWYEPSAGLVVTMVAADTDPSVLTRVAEGLRVGRPGEVDDLVRAHGSSGSFERLQPGEVVVTEGEDAEGRPWRVVASDDGSDGFGLEFADDYGSSGTGVSKDGGWGTLSVDVASHGEAGLHDPEGRTSSVGIYGAVTSEATELVVEVPGHEPIVLELHIVTGIAGWDEKVFGAMVPVDLGPAEVVARDSAGNELARVPLDVAAGGMSSSGDGATEATIDGEASTSSETCRTLPDGGEECSASSSGSASGSASAPTTSVDGG